MNCLSKLVKLLITAPIFWTSAQVSAESLNRCYLIPEIIQIPKRLSGFTPEVFSPQGDSVILSKENQKILFDFKQPTTQNLGEIQNPTFSPSGVYLTFEVNDENSSLVIQNLKSGKTQKIPNQPLCGHHFVENTERVQVLTCNGFFKTYDLSSDPPRLLSKKPSEHWFRPTETHFNLDQRGSLIISPTDNDPLRTKVHLIDFQHERIFSAPMTLPTNSDPIQFLTQINSSNSSVETQNEIARGYRMHGGTSISRNGRSALVWDSDGSATHINFEEGKTQPLSQTRSPSMSFGLSPQGHFVFSRKTSNQESPNEGWIKFKQHIYFNQITFASDDSKIAYTTPDKTEIRIRDLLHGKEIRIAHQLLETDKQLAREKETLFFNGDASQLLLYREARGSPEIVFFNSKTGKKEKTLPLKGTTFHRENRLFDKTGSKLFIGNAPFSVNGVTDSIDLTTGDVEHLDLSPPRQGAIDSPIILWPYLGYKNAFLWNRRVCTQPFPFLSDPAPKPCDSDSSGLNISALELLKHHFSRFDSAQLLQACKNHRKGEPFHPVFIQSISRRLNELNLQKGTPPSKTELNALLLALQNPEVPLDPEKFLSLIHAGEKSGTFKQDPTLLQNLLIRLFNENKGLYFQVIAHSGGQLGPSPSLEQSCFSPSEITQMKEHLISYLSSSSGKPTPFSRIIQLRPLAPLFMTFNPQETDRIFEDLGLAAAKAAQPNYPGLMTSTLYYFVSPAIREQLLGNPRPSYTEFSVLNENKKLIPVAISTTDIDSGNLYKNHYGFHIKSLQSPELPKSEKEEITQNYHWSTAGNQLTAQLRLKQVPSSQLFPSRTGPDYPALWKDGAMIGLILLGSNLGRDALTVGQEYIRYYRDQGFSFNLFSDEVDDVRTFLKERISSGEIDYLVKEAHSGGVRQDLINVINKADLRVGTRKRPDGKTEKIYILLPRPEGASRTISTTEFGSWIQNRDKTNQGELVYFNTSCFAGDRAASDVAAAGTSKLLVIPVHPAMTASFFINQPQGAIYQLLESIRSDQNFDGFRQNLSKVPEYQNKSHNVYLMPDDPDYQEKIIQQLNDFPIHARIEIRDQNGKEVHFDPLTSIHKTKEVPTQ